MAYQLKTPAVSCAAAFLCMLPLVSGAAESGQARNLPGLLGEAQRLISNGQTLQALEIIEKAKSAAALVEGQTLALQEEVHWQDAMMTHEFADQLEDYHAYTSYAGKARRKWREYIQWYHRLNADEREKLPKLNRRIAMATAHLGNACSRMHDIWGMFDEYRNIEAVDYLGVNTISLWKRFLYQCPDWSAPSERTVDVRRTKICNDRCTEQWLVYADSLEEWVDTQDLRRTVKNSYLREIEQIRGEAEECRD